MDEMKQMYNANTFKPQNRNLYTFILEWWDTWVQSVNYVR